jgi:hypothetical protein
MSISQTQLKGTVVLNSDAGANLTVGNATATNAITGTTNINTTGGGTTTIGTANTGTTNIKGRILNILNDVITGASPYPTINIGRNNTSGPDSTTTNIDGTVNIGYLSGGDTTINQLYTDWIYAVTDASTLNVGVNLITGDPINNNIAISIGENLSSGKIEIGKNQTTGTIELGAGSATTNTRNITIGNTTGLFDTNTTLTGKTTISKLATPLTPIYAYPVIGVDQIGYSVKVDIPVNTTITTAQMTLVTLPSVSSGKWLISFLMMIKGGVTNNIGVSSILFKDTTPLTYAVTWVGGTSVNSSNNIVLCDDVTVGSTSVYKINTVCNQAHATSLAFTTLTAPIFTINNAGYLQATRIA